SATGELADAAQSSLQHLAVQKNECDACQALSRRRYLALHRQPGKKSMHLGFAHFQRLPQLMTAAEVANPLPIAVLGTNAVVMHAHHCTDLLAQAHFSS